MRIRLISSDGFLYRLCREVLLGFRDRVWDFGMVASYEEARGCDLLLWDLPAETQFPEGSDFGSEERCIYLLARRQLKLLQRRPKLAGLSLVLKPVNPVLLRALLEEALSQYQSRSAEGRAVEQMRLERDEMLQHLLHANLRLQEYDQDRTNFLAHSVHDLRAPLGAVHGYCSLLLDNQLGPLNPEQTKVLERMERSLRRLSRLTSGMFQISVGPLAPRSPTRRMGDIEACIEQAVHEVAPLLEAKKIDLRLEVSPPVDKLPIDEMHIEQVLVNLLDNACRFTPKKGRIEIRACPAFWDRRHARLREAREFPDRRRSVSYEPNAYRIEVRDWGPGIPPGMEERIFDEYITASPNDEWSRAGLGLAICRRIIDAHQGIVFAESKGHGATLVFMLPCAGEMKRVNRPQVSAGMIRVAACE
jgi:signal transduction histidine kinase